MVLLQQPLDQKKGPELLVKLINNPASTKNGVKIAFYKPFNGVLLISTQKKKRDLKTLVKHINNRPWFPDLPPHEGVTIIIST